MTLALERVEMARGGSTLLRDVSFALDGGVVAVVGPNGVGKTTLLRAMAGALAPVRGSIALEGVDVRALDARERARTIALVDPMEPVLAALLVEDAVAAARFPHHRWWEWEATAEDDSRHRRRLARTGLTAFRRREIGTLSAGERQRVWIALAIAQRASVILFDEPTSHLDLKASVETLQLVRELADAGALVVAVLHQLEEAAAFADRIIVLGAGGVVADGTPESALTPSSIERAYGVAVTVERGLDGLAFHRPATLGCAIGAAPVMRGRSVATTGRKVAGAAAAAGRYRGYWACPTGT